MSNRPDLQRFATEPPPAPLKKKKSVVRRLIFYTTAATATFYVTSAFVSFKVPVYHDFFVENVPLGASFLQYAEDHEWDTLTVRKAVDSGKEAFGVAWVWVNDFISNNGLEKAKESAIRKVHETEAAAAEKIQESKERIKSMATAFKTTVEKSEDEIYDKGSKAAAIAKHQSEQFSDGVEDLAREAEAALSKKPTETLPEVITTPEQPAVSPLEITPPHDIEAPESGVQEVLIEKPKNLYDIPLPIGFEPPPGFSRPAPPKPAPAPELVKEEAALPPLPLVAPAVSEFSASEPVIAQLASVIDDLASYLNSNPTAAEKARDILDSAKVDLTELATRIDQVKAEEQKKLEAKLDEQTREYTVKLLELEMQAQDKLDNQEEDFRKFFEQEKASFVQAYRQKLDHELHTQSEIINERLKEEVIAQGIEMQRRWIREIKVRVEQERGGRLAKLDELATNLKRLERVALDNSAYLDENIRIHALWSALRAVNHTVESPVRKPFREELRVLRHVAAAREDPVVSAALESLEASDVPDVGVEPLADLASWFTTSVAPRVSTVALVPDQNAGVLSHLASNLFSSFRFQRQGLVPGSDVLSVLARAEYYLNEKDLDNATRELNQLKGTAKILLTDWLDAARKRLEVLQALEVVQAQATLASLLVVQD
ncbi:MICOS complex subunit MIC60 [Grifola frondosa]|uniref:MICOS complex subunit MIC60 n=1 Tax=Grifola frondosa TaxID=5627 RepID=A0A1C7M6S0_GRIFR|nr:MICOS complex subunit MIC60 [Grifola frondosa]